MQKNVEYIVLEKINRCADCGRRLIGKTGVNPAQSRYCKGKFTAICHWETGKAQLNVEPEPGDLPVTGILHLREIGGYLHRLFIYALSREGIFILKGGLGQFTRNYTQTVKRAADNKRRYAPGEGSIPPVLLSGVSKGVSPLAHDFAEQSVVCYTLCRRCPENTVAAGEGKGI